MRSKLTILLFVLSLSSANAQFKQDTGKKVHVIVLPLVLRSPETLWAGGVTSSVSFKAGNKHDPQTRTSTIQGLVLFTERKQNIQAIDATIFFPKDRYVFLFQTSHSYFPDKYWGLGPRSKEIDREDYAFHQVYIFPHLKKKISKSIFIGVLYEFQNVFNIHYLADGLYSKTIKYGKSDYVVSGPGGSISYDTRNSSYWPTKGLLIQGTFTTFNSYFGSTYNDFKSTMDVRYFKKLFKNTVIAAQVYSYSNTGQVPIKEMAALGGANNLRGFYQGRFRDDKMTTVIAEYRIPIYKRFSTCVFGGIGNVYRKIKDVTLRTIKHSYGAGVRIAILPKEKLNIRIDYGYADRYNKGFYFTVGESF